MQLECVMGGKGAACRSPDRGNRCGKSIRVKGVVVGPGNLPWGPVATRTGHIPSTLASQQDQQHQRRIQHVCT